MKAEYKIKREILRSAQENEPEEFSFSPLDTVEQIQNAYDKFNESDVCGEYESDFRSGEVETNLPSEYSRHYVSKSVAMQTTEGDWVGWCYWYGGGKYGEPESIDWMADAYNLSCTEEEKVVKVRTFTRLEG